MKFVIIESPYKGKDWSDTEENIRFGQFCMRDCLLRGEAPYASHLLYTQKNVLNDKVPAERKFGMEAGFEVKTKGDLSAVYINRGVSSGMFSGVRRSIIIDQDFEYRLLLNYDNSLLMPVLFTITGAAGVGKTTIVKKLLNHGRGLKFVRSFTTRSPRPSDLPGEYRYDIPKRKFESDRGRYLWVLQAHGNLYGTQRRSVSLGLTESIASTLVPNVMVLVPEAVSILRHYILSHPNFPHYEERIKHFYILAPRDKGELERRLRWRGDSARDIRKRVSDCKRWDTEALESDIPYIFIRNEEGCVGIEKAVQQMLLFF